MMPEYTVRDETTGQTVTFNWQGDTDPTDADMEEVFREARNFVSSKNNQPAQAESPFSLKETAKRYVGAGEALWQTATGVIAPIVAGVAGTITSAGWNDPEKGAETVEKVQNALYYQPTLQPEYAKQWTDVINKPLEVLEKVGQKAGDVVFDATGSPELAAGTKAGLMVAAPGLAKRGYAGTAGAIRSLEGKAAPALYESSIKIPPSVDTAIRDRVVQTGLNEGIPVSKGGLVKNRGNIDILNREIANVIDEGTKAGDVVSTADVVSRIDNLKDFYKDYPRARKYLNEIDEIKAEIIDSNPDTLTLAQAQRMKQKIYQIQRKHYGEMKGVDIEADKAMARGLKEEIVELRPELKKLNAKDSAMIELDDFLSRAVNRIGNYETIRIADVGMSVAGGAKIGLINHYLNNPWFKSKLAIILNKSSKKAANPSTRAIGIPPTNREDDRSKLYRY